MATKKDHFPKTDSCNENARLFFTVWTQIVFAHFSKKWHFYKKKSFFFTTTQKTIFFWAFFEIFLFHFFHIVLFTCSNIKNDKNKKCTFFFENPFFDTLTNCQKYFRTPTHYLCFFRPAKNTIKLGEKQAKKILDGISTQPWTDFQLKNPQILDRFSTLQHMHAYIYSR